MLDFKYLRDHIDEVKEKIKQRGVEVNWENLLDLDISRRELLKKVEDLRYQKNTVSEKISQLKREKKDASQEIENMRALSQHIKELDSQLQNKEAALKELMLIIPNLPHSSVAVGKSSEDNPEIKKCGEIPRFSFQPKPHWEIGEDLSILDFDRAAKITGARFVLYRDLGAKIERALINFMLDLHSGEHHYLEVLPPFIVNRESMISTGQLPKFDLIVLGMGAEGHTGSLFPNSYAPFDTEDLACVVYVLDEKLNRITLTHPVLRAASHLVVLVCGQEKEGILKTVLTSEPDEVRYPIHVLWPVLDRVTWLVDSTAAQSL